jgi:hypothetical protein
MPIAATLDTSQPIQPLGHCPVTRMRPRYAVRITR